MIVAARVRLFLARRPWIYWLAVALLAAGIAVATQQRLAAVDDARRRWDDRRTVAVATRDHQPGDEIVTRAVELPLAAVPRSALDRVEPGARARQRVGRGEIVVAADVMAPTGPAAGAEPGTVVVPIVDTSARDVRIGLAVRVVAEGIVLAEEGTIVEIADDVVFVSVAPEQAPPVAAAARSGTASLLFLP